MRKFWVIFIFLLLKIQYSRADEGMWLPHLLNAISGNLYDKGLKLDINQIYNPHKPSLTDAVVSFGGYCTGELISPNGLIITNHHCGYRPVQKLSSTENDYLKKGFWAYTQQQEIPCEGLYVTFIVKIIDLTPLENLLPDSLKNSMSRPKMFELIAKKVADTAIVDSRQKYLVRPFFYDQQYIMFITETFEDVRLVATPPEFIGKFGGDTDNWVWPRHTGDFALFRIYAGKDNRPAPYSPDNQPYQSKYFFPISLKQLDEGDFTMILGFPGRTQEYLTSHYADYILNELNPMRIEIREKLLATMKEGMRKDRSTAIKYAAKYSGKSNYYKKWLGENFGLKKTSAISHKTLFEKKFLEKVSGITKYDTILTHIFDIENQFFVFDFNLQAYSELFFSGFEILTPAFKYMRLSESGKSPEEIYQEILGFYRDFEPDLDQALMKTSFPLIKKYIHRDFIPATLINNSNTEWIENLYNQSIFADTAKLKKFIALSEKKKQKILKKDPVFQLANEVYDIYLQKIYNPYYLFNEKLNRAYTIYMEGIMKYMAGEKKLYPDANGTLRLAYGNIASTHPRDGVKYLWYTTQNGLLEKYIPGDEEFHLDSTFYQLLKSKDFEPYADNEGNLRICFIANNHTTGGNSGSPVLNAEGFWIGINFDRSWESTMSDIYYDPTICRNIAMTAHYFLFIIDKYAKLDRVLNELEIIR